MPLTVYLSGGEFRERSAESLAPVVEALDQDVLYEAPSELIAAFLARYGKLLTRHLLDEDGIIYLASWMRESNLKHYLALNLNPPEALDRFVASGERDTIWLRAQPRGVVSHWVAGNVPTLSIFSLVQSMLAKNANLLRIPESALPGAVRILEVMKEVEVERDGRTLRGSDVLRSIAVVYFPSGEGDHNREMSMLADCKVVWGGREAVRSIVALPQRDHCETVVFGPKYSFAVVDEPSLSEALCRRLAMDVITFEQEACSSPQVLFVEGRGDDPRATARRAAEMLGAAFSELSEKYPKMSGNFSGILNTRGRYWLDPRRDIVCSPELDWTVLIDDNLELEEPVGSRTVFVKVVDDVLDIVPLITNKVQTLGIALRDDARHLRLCEKATRAGVARCVPIGVMNNYDTPWDGILFINRLVRWTAMRPASQNGHNHG